MMRHYYSYKDYCFYIDDRFDLYDNGCVFLWFGDLWINGNKFTKDYFHHDMDQIMRNITGSGVFICLSLDKDAIECYTTTHNSCYIFLSKNKQDINISIGIHGIISNKEKPTINPIEIKEYIFSKKLFHEKTIFNSVVFFKPGYIEKIDFNLNLISSLFRPSSNGNYKNDVFSMIKDNITSSFDGRDIGLYYSGGFDSTLLLYIMKEMNITFKPYYKMLSEFSNNGELYIAKKKCSELGIELIKTNEVFDYSLDSYFGKKYDFPHQVSLCLSYDSSGNNSINDNSVQFFCGHGGDAVFGQNSIGLSCVDAFKDQGLLVGFKKMAELATLKGITLKEIILNLYSERKVMINPKPGKYEHMINIIESLYSKNGMSSHGEMDIISPLLFENVIEHFLGFDSYQHFTANYDRAIIRKMANDRFNDPCFLNCSKYSSSDVIFNILNVKREQIKYAVKKTKLLQIIGVTEEYFNEKLLYQSSVMYIAEDYLFIHKLYQVAIFLLLHEI